MFWYDRKIPVSLIDAIGKKFNRQSLRTDDLLVARRRRDVVADADNDYWADLKNGRDIDVASIAYERVVSQAQLA